MVVQNIKNKFKLMGSAGSKADLEKLIKARWYWSKVSIGEDGSVSNSKGVVEGFRVVVKNGRWRLEMESI
jgi:hypothetical protein